MKKEIFKETRKEDDALKAKIAKLEGTQIKLEHLPPPEKPCFQRGNFNTKEMLGFALQNRFRYDNQNVQEPAFIS